MQFLSMQQAGLLQANLNSNQNTKLSCFYIGVIIEVGKTVDKINAEEFEYVFNAIPYFYIRFLPIQIPNG